MRIACWILKEDYKYTVKLCDITFLLQQWLHEPTSMLRYTYIACLVLLLVLLTYSIQVAVRSKA